MTCSDSDGLKQAVGASWSPTDDQCIICTCKQGKKDLYADCFNTRVLASPDCPPEYIVTSEDGCIETCTMVNEKAGCMVTTDYDDFITVNIGGEECVSLNSHKISMCTGVCESNTVVKDGELRKECSCCQVLEKETIEIPVMCGDVLYTHMMDVPKSCSCNFAECKAEEVEEDDDSVVDVVVDVVDDVVDEVVDTIGGWWSSWF